MLLLCSCDFASTDPEISISNNPIGVTLVADLDLVQENDSDSRTITANLTEEALHDITVNLGVEGTATYGTDYELSSTRIVIEAGDLSGSTTLTPIRDWDPDGGEVAVVRIGSVNGGIAQFPNVVHIHIGDGPIPESYKEEISADLRSFVDLFIAQDSILSDMLVYNLGAAATSETTMHLVFRTDLHDPATNVHHTTYRIPGLRARGTFRLEEVVHLEDFEPNQIYYGFTFIDQAPEETTQSSSYGQALTGFELNNRGEVVTRCQTQSSNAIEGVQDPLFADQWHLENTGQSAYATEGGVQGADMQMQETLEKGPSGQDVRVAVVDTGLETCHPDLVRNIERNKSYNFAVYHEPITWYGAIPSDPYNAATLGDHGTAVAGIIAATAHNEIGGRGIASRAWIRGFNYLTFQYAGSSISLGMSSQNPPSSDVDVFNLSYGRSGSQSNPSSQLRNTYEHGTSSLRDGLGAIYVKSAGNGFSSCRNVEHPLHSEIGCRSSVGDPTNNLPYLVVVGGFNAHDTRASYASAGSNIWVTAPAGQSGRSQPGIVTTDQQTLIRGYDVISNRGYAVDTAQNKDGNYISTFNGTSASAPMVSGAAAVLLSANAELTWRDVKYILASTARKIDPDSKSVRIAFGGSEPYTAQHGWLQNAAGFWFHNWYGFGAVSLDAAVEMARTYIPDSLGEFVESDWITMNTDLSIPDFNSGGVSSELRIVDLPSSASIEAVTLEIRGSHERLSDIGISLTSPAGMTSVLNPIFNDALVRYDSISWQLLSNAFFGESPNGIWTLNVVDAAEQDTGSITSWGLKFYYGEHPDN